MTLTANSSGVIVGKFSTPAVNPASKKLTFTGGSGSVAEAVFFADGVFGEVKKNGRITTADVLSPPIIDANSAVPIFQVFQTPFDADISSVGLHFSAIGATFVSVQIREMDGDYPSRLFVRAAVVKASLIAANSWHDFVFDAPILLSAGKKYALCVFCSDVATELSVANVGSALSSTETATNTNHLIGELYTSANGVDYQHQKNKVLAFRVKKPTYTEAVKTIDLGVVTVTNINRICVLSPSNPTLNGLSADRVLLIMPDSTIIHALDGQVISLATTVTGNIAVSKRIYSNSNRSSVAVGGTQILVGRVGTSGDYISAPIISEVGGSLRVCVEANAPIGSDVAVFVSDADVVSWTPASLVGSPIDLGDGTSRFVFVSSALSTTRSIYKIHLAGTTELVPIVYSSSVESGVFVAASDALVAHNSNVTAHGLDALRLRLIANGVDADLLATNHITDIDNAFSLPSGSFNTGTTGAKPYTDGVCETHKLGSIYCQLAQDAVTGEFSTRVFNVSWTAWRYHASKAGDSLQVFSAANGMSGKEVVNFSQLDTKAAKAGDSLQVFSAADGMSGKEVVNFSQLDTKAAKAGDSLQVFQVANGVSGNDAINFDQLVAAAGTISGIIPDISGKAEKNGSASELFSVQTATSDNHAPTFKQLNDGLTTKAAKAGDSSQKFSAADGTTGKEVVNFDQLDAVINVIPDISGKAEKNGSASELFSVQTATSDNHAPTFKQLNDGLTTKAAKAGDSSQKFSAADGTTGKEVVNFDQLDAGAIQVGGTIRSVYAESTGVSLNGTPVDVVNATIFCSAGVATKFRVTAKIPFDCYHGGANPSATFKLINVTDGVNLDVTFFTGTLITGAPLPDIAVLQREITITTVGTTAQFKVQGSAYFSGTAGPTWGSVASYCTLLIELIKT